MIVQFGLSTYCLITSFSTYSFESASAPLTRPALKVSFVAFDPPDGRAWIKAVSDTLTSVQQMGFMPIIMCSSVVRQLVYSSIEREMPGVVVVSEKEILSAGNSIGLEVLGEISEEGGR